MAIIKLSKERSLQGKNINVVKRSGGNGSKEHWHEYYEMILYRRCDGVCSINGRDFKIDRDCIFLMTPSDFQKTEIIPSETSSSILVQFTEQIVDIEIMKTLSSAPIVYYEPCALITEMVDDLSEVFASEGKMNAEYVSHILNCILIKVIELGQPIIEEKTKASAIIREAVLMMLENLHTRITLESLSEHFGLSSTYFSHLFHKATGIPFKRYLTALRIEYAKRLLEQGQTSVIDIGYECGYQTPSQFVRAFRSIMGVPPSKYKSSKKKANKSHI